MIKLLKIIGVVCLVGLLACNEESISDEDSSTQLTTTSDSQEAQYTETTFSSYLEMSSDRNYLRISFSFFPDGTDFDFDAKTASIPCAFFSRIPDDVDVQLSAPTEDACEPYVITFNETGESFTLDGIVVPFASQYEKFADDFEFTITQDGVLDAEDNILLTSDGGKLEDYFDLILEKRGD